MDAHHVNATCVSIDGRGVLLMGPSGSGKSDLALRLIDEGAQLVGDDQITVRLSDGALLAGPHERIEGMIEARGVGILHMPCARDVPVALAVTLIAREDVDRLPPQRVFDCLGVRAPLLALHAFDASATAKIRAYLSQPFKEST